MVEQARSWRIERNGTVVFSAICGELTCYAQDYRSKARHHRHPAWQLLLSWGGGVSVHDDRGRVTTGPGMLVPPALSHTVTHSGGFTSIWIDPYHLAVPEPSRAHRLDLAQVGRLLIDLDAEFDPDRLRRAISDTFGEPPSIDPRLQQVLAALDEGTGLDELATRADLSPRRLRQLTHAGSLATLRRWHRLRNAGFLFPFHPASEVAALTDFADQAHLIRTTLALTGRTPGSLHGRQGR